MTPEDKIEDQKFIEILDQFAEDLTAGRCPHCKKPMTQEQSGRCVYAYPCGHRLYQGTANKTIKRGK